MKEALPETFAEERDLFREVVVEALEGETVAFVRCLHRKGIYRYFP